VSIEIARISAFDTAVATNPDARPGNGPSLFPSTGEYPAYDTLTYLIMASDDIRNECFRAALAGAVPGRVVLDIGTGSRLHWAHESLRLGAKHVTAMEVMESSYQKAVKNVRSWHLEDAVTLLHGPSTDFDLERSVDVCVAEIIGSLAGAEGAAAVLSHARATHLKDDGIVIPHRAVTMAAAVSLSSVLNRESIVFPRAAVSYIEKLFQINGRPFDMRLRVSRPELAAIVSDSAEVEILDFNGLIVTDQEREVTLTVLKDGSVDGILVWMKLWCCPDQSPVDALHQPTHWGTVYFPLFSSEVPVTKGDRLELSFRVALSDDFIHPDYHLSASLRSRDRVHYGQCSALHHGGEFRAHPVYRTLFPS
jgi:type I protein arginine methyltransferase